MLLIEFIVVAVLVAAGIIFMEYKFAQMNKAESGQEPEHIEKILEKLGATEIISDGKGWYCFQLDDEILWLNLSVAPLMEVMVQNSIKDCPNVAVAEQVAKDITSRLAGGRVTIKDGCIYVGWASLFGGEDALREGLPILFCYLFQVRDRFITEYWKALAATNQHNDKPVS